MPCTSTKRADDFAHLLCLEEDEPKWTEEQVRAYGRELGLEGDELDAFWAIAQGPIGP